ncbi:MAG: hypothetical protein NTZ59_09825 [Bacteroidetes bacterium]|nr:hypothetical protein [Bacteroidota bacterium]
MGVLTGITNGTFTFNGTTMQDITSWDDYTVVNNKNGFKNGAIVIINNSNGARILSDVSVAGTLTLTSGKVRTNNFSLVMLGSASTITGATFGVAATSYIATCDGSGTAATTGGLVIQNIGSGGRTSTVTFPIGTNTTYNPCSVANANAAVAFTARVNSTPFSGTTTDSTIARTWNIQPASGTPSAVIGLQWNGGVSEEGANFNRTSASIAQWNGTSVSTYSSGGAATGSNPYSLNSGATQFTSFGDFGLIPGIVIPANEPSSQVSNASVTSTTGTTATLTWTPVSGTNSIVIIKQGSAVTAAPVDGITYADASSVYTSGTNLGSGNYVAYIGTAGTATITGLTIGTTYHFAVYSFNGANGTENYLTTSPATANGTTSIPTYYYMGGNSTTNTFATANMWATSVGGNPLAAFTPSNNDVLIFDGTNLGNGSTFPSGGDSATLVWINSNTTAAKIILQNNARVRLESGGTRTTTIGNSGFAANTIVLDVPTGCKLYTSGNGTTINLAANSSANISGYVQLGNTVNNTSLIPNATGSTISINSGAYVEINGSSSSVSTFGTSSTPLTTIANGATLKVIKAGDIFGGTTANALSLAPNSLFIYANTSNSTAISIGGRTLGKVQIEANWTPAGQGGITMYDVTMPNTTGYKFTINDTTAINFKGNITIATGNTIQFNTNAATTITACNFNGSAMQTITNNGSWTVGSSLRQNFTVSNGFGLSVGGSTGISTSGLTGSSFTVNSGNTLGLNGGSLTVPNSGTLNINGSLTRTAGNILANSSTCIVNITGASNIPANTFRGDTCAILTLNNASGITCGGSINIITALNLTNGVINMGNNLMIIGAGKTVTRTNGWINGNLRKNVSSGSNVARTFEIGDAFNYLPVSMTFASVTTAGDMTAKISAPASSQPNYATATVSNSNYINRYWSLSSVNTLAFTNYNFIWR